MMKIGEGGSNVLKLYVMRCLLNDFLKNYKKIADQELSLAQRFSNLIKVSAGYAKGYFKSSKIPKKNMPQPLYQHMSYVRKTQRRFNRMIIIKVIAEYQHYYCQIGINYLLKRPLQQIPKPETSFEQRQVLLGHCAQIAMLLSVMTVTCQRAAKDASPEAIELADEFCIRARDKISIFFLSIANHSRKRENTMNKRGENIMNGNFADTVEQNIFRMDLPNIKN